MTDAFKLKFHPGLVGPATNLTVGTVTTGDAGTSASVTISGDAPNQTIDFTIPRGAPGGDQENLIINGGMQISQENGTTAGSTTGYYPVDQWEVGFVTSAGVLSTAQVASATPGGSTHRLRISVTTADASLAAGEYLYVRQKIEGYRAAAARFGGASAKNILCRFGFKGPAGTYTACLRNLSTATRSYPVNFTISAGQANTDTVQTITFIGDTSGSWATDGTNGMELMITLAAGSTFQGTNGAWNAGNYYGTSSTSNGLSANTNVFELFDAGLYVDYDASGVTPPWELPDYERELKICQQYWLIAESGIEGYAVDLGNIGARVYFPAPMRAVPSLVDVEDIASSNIAVPTDVFTFNESKLGMAIYTAPFDVGHFYWHLKLSFSARM